MKKIITSLFIFVFSMLFINNVNAVTINESTDPIDGLTTIEDNSIVIGVTRFEDGVVITAQRAATAGVNDALFNIDLEGYSGVNIYYYLSGSWFILDDENQANPLDESNPAEQQIIEELQQPEIYYVNNVEKQLTVDFTFDGEGNLAFNTDNNKDGLVSFADGKLTIPATVKSLQIEIKDPDTEDVIGLVVLTKDPVNNTDYETTSLTNYIKKLAEAKEAALDIKSEAELRASLAYEGVTELKLNQDVNLVNRLDITGGKVITLDLNGKTLSRNSETIRVNGGTLNVIGTGTIKENVNNGYAPILIKGSSLYTDTNYSNVNIGENVTLKGWAGIFIDQKLIGSPYAYGVNVIFNGRIVSPAEVEHTTAGFGIYVNGNIQHTINEPNITVGGKAIIGSNISFGIYAAGYANWIIEDGASISGSSAIEIKAGNMIINGGAFTPTQNASSPTHKPAAGATSTTGYAIAVVNNAGYGNTLENPLTVTINGGTFNGNIEVLDDDVDTTNNYAVLTNNYAVLND